MADQNTPLTEETSLEMHVNLCSVRFNALNDNLSAMKDTMSELKTDFKELRAMIEDQKAKSFTRAEKFNNSIIYGLLVIIGTVALHLYFK